MGFPSVHLLTVCDQDSRLYIRNEQRQQENDSHRKACRLFLLSTTPSAGWVGSPWAQTKEGNWFIDRKGTRAIAPDLPLHRDHETVPQLWQGFDESGMFG